MNHKDSRKEEKMKNLTDSLVSFSTKIANNRVLQTIQRAFMRLMPITMIGGFASLFKGLSIGGYQAWLQSTPIYSILGAIYQFTVGLLGVYVAFLVAYECASTYNIKKSGNVGLGLVSLASFLVVTPYEAAADSYSASTLSTQWLGSTGMFAALIIAFVTAAIFKFCESHNIEIKLPEQVPPAVAQQFTALIPGSITVVFWGAISGVFALTSIGSFQQAIYTVVSAPLSMLGANIFGEWVIVVVLYAMWFFGIHGGMTVMPIMMLLFTQLQMENLAAYQAGQTLPNMVTGGYLSYGSGSLPLLIAALFVCKSKSNQSITKLALLPSFFGVDEPAYFGLPMILNPIFFIPWVIITPTISVWLTYGLQCAGLLGYATGASAGSFVPFFVSNLVSYGVRGVIFGCIMFVVDVLVYIPFIKAYDKQMLEQEAQQEKELEEKRA